jgi:hypothetical protein
MATEVLEGAVSLAVLPVDWGLDHDRAVVTGTAKRSIDVVHPHPNHVGEPTRLWRLSVAANIGDYHGTVVADRQLARWLSPIRVRSTKPNAEVKNATAARTSG